MEVNISSFVDVNTTQCSHFTLQPLLFLEEELLIPSWFRGCVGTRVILHKELNNKIPKLLLEIELLLFSVHG
jgi:hypothetical protein